MLQSAQTPNSPDWWLLRLGNRLYRDRHRLNDLYSYWRGEHPLPFGNRKMREAYKRFQDQSKTNFMKLVAESVVERLNVSGFRVGGTDGADDQAWLWWTANNLQADSSLVHRAAITMSRAYAIVGEDPDNPGEPLITGEDPRQVIHESSPTNRRKVLSALKVWADDVDQKLHAAVYLPDRVCYYVSQETADKMKDQSVWDSASWEVDTSQYPAGSALNPLGEVPVVPFLNAPDLSGKCLGEFEDVTPIQDRINTEVLDRMVISAMQAYRQRYATGVEATDENGNPSNDFDPGADLMWIVPDDKAKFGEFSAADLSGPLNAVSNDIQHLAAITRTPPHYLIGQMVNVSGDALAAAESGLVSKVTERSNEFGRSWVTVHRLASKVAGNPLPSANVEVMWVNPQFRTLTEMASASVQLMTAGVPWRTRMTLCEFSPAEITRMQQERVMDALLNPNPDYTIPGPDAVAAPGSPPTPAGPGGAAQPAAKAAKAAGT